MVKRKWDIEFVLLVENFMETSSLISLCYLVCGEFVGVIIVIVTIFIHIFKVHYFYILSEVGIFMDHGIDYFDKRGMVFWIDINSI